jgi:hypothetical protein
MAAYKHLVLSEGDVAFNNASAHVGRGHVALLGVLGEVQGGAAVADAPVMRFHGRSLACLWW